MSDFVDYVKIYCRSGKEVPAQGIFTAKFVPQGRSRWWRRRRGGHIILRGNRNYWTLIHLKYARHVFAGNGSPEGNAVPERTVKTKLLKCPVEQ